MPPRPRASCCIPTAGNQSYRSILSLLIFLSVLLGLVVTTTAWAIDIDSASWSNRRDRLEVRGDRVPDESTVTIVYAGDGAELGTAQADGDGDWRFRITNPDPAPCRVRAIAADGDTDERDVSSAPNDCSNDGDVVQPPPDQACNISVSPTTLAFGDVTVGNSPTLSTTVSNSGTAACSVNLVRSGSNDFAVTSATSFNVAPSGSQNVSVSYTPGEVAADNGNVAVNSVAVNSNDPNTATVDVSLTGNGVDDVVVNCTPATQGLSINSTSQDGCPEQTVPEVNTLLNGSFRVLAINDLGMHCGDLDTRISSILPPFQVLLAQVIDRNAAINPDPNVNNKLNPAGVDLEYSAASNSNDPILGQPDAVRGLKGDGSTYKTNFWDAVAGGAYDAFYPFGVTPLLSDPFPVTVDVGLPVPNVEELYIGTDGVVDQNCLQNPPGCDGTLTAVQHAMPGLTAPYLLNAPQAVEEHYGDKPFFVNFPFGYVAENVNWYEGAGIPFAAYDDFGRENAYPLVRVEAKQGTNTVATVDTVLPISGEASCKNCHSDPSDVQNSRTTQPTNTLVDAGLPVATSALDDPDFETLPLDVSVEYAADINIVRLHDLTHGAKYVNTAGVSTPCDVTANLPSDPNGGENCLINQALVQGKPVVCQVCHYTPALDLAQVGPVAGAPGTAANGRNQLAQSSNSNVMHSHHGQFTDLFPPMPAPNQQADGTITNQGTLPNPADGTRLKVLEDTCYQCHPGTNVQCLRGAMFNGGMLCNDCHGDMEQVGKDFSRNVSPGNPGAFELGGDFYDPNDPQPRVPWANEPGCGSCHTGDVRNNAFTLNGNPANVDVNRTDVIVNTADLVGNTDNIRLRQTYRISDNADNNGKATPIVPTNKRFAEPAVPAVFAQPGTDFDNPGAGNPQLYRVSTGHGGVMCEGCHGATHAEWPNANPLSNDNITSDQLQGHTGTIIECSTCHTGDLGNTLDGPHGMHPVGANTDFADGGHEDLADDNPNACRVCHGNNGEGSVLSRVAVDRDFGDLEDGGIVRKGDPVTCTECHENEL